MISTGKATLPRQVRVSGTISQVNGKVQYENNVPYDATVPKMSLFMKRN